MCGTVIFGASSMTSLESSKRSRAAAMRDQSLVGEFLAGDVLEQDAGLGGEEAVHHLVAVLLEREQDARDLPAQARVPGEVLRDQALAERRAGGHGHELAGPQVRDQAAELGPREPDQAGRVRGLQPLERGQEQVRRGDRIGWRPRGRRGRPR